MDGQTVGTVDITTASTSAFLIQRTNKTTNEVVNTATRIFHIHIISGAGGGSVLTIANGNGGTQRINITGTTSKGIDFDFGKYGMSFPLGAYYTTDTNIVNAATICKGDNF